MISRAHLGQRELEVTSARISDGLDNQKSAPKQFRTTQNIFAIAKTNFNELISIKKKRCDDNGSRGPSICEIDEELLAFMTDERNGVQRGEIHNGNINEITSVEGARRPRGRKKFCQELEAAKERKAVESMGGKEDQASASLERPHTLQSRVKNKE